MRIGPFATQQEILSIGPELTLSEAARRMWDRRAGSALVEAKGEKPAIVTERDLLRAFADGVDLTTTQVNAYMTPDAVTVTANWHVVDVARTMIERGFRHVIMLDDVGQVVGVLSIRDVVRAMLEDRQGTLAG
jgi:CBS domain-containing protein